MKKVVLLMTLIVGPVFGQTPPDIRILNNRTVNLAPLHDWAATQNHSTNSRPLAHWKILRSPLYLGEVAGQPKVSVQTESGSRATYLIRHLPAQIAATAAEIDKLTATAARQSAWCDTEAKRLERLEAVTPIAASGARAYVDGVMAQRAKLNLDQVNLRAKEAEVTALKSRAGALNRELAQEVIIAMPIGQNYTGLEILDCGQKTN